MKKNQTGFSVIETVIVLFVLACIGVLGWFVLSRINSDSSSSQSNNSKPSSEQKSESFIWQQTADGWQATQKAPDCPSQPMLKTPVETTAVTSVLYPGQTRGGNYKPHGGFRFDNSKDNKVTVTAPIDGFLVRGSRYLVEGEVQYTFDAMNNCGVMYRVGHLRELPDNLQKIADTWPKPTESSATQPISPAVLLKQGSVLATKVGILSANNTFLDWGVFDYRQQNEASKSPAYQAAHGENNGKDTTWYAVCWLEDWLPESDQKILTTLPAGDPGSGKNSDYCT